jgi:hypothetical protein
MASVWTPARRKAHAVRIRQLRADPQGPYADQAAKLARAHAEGRHPGFGNRPVMSDDEHRTHNALAQRRYRARKAGQRITRAMFPARAYWPTVEAACERLDAMLADDAATSRAVGTNGFLGTSRIVLKPVHPLECLWSPRPMIETASATDTDVDSTLRTRQYRPERRGGVVTGWESVYAHKHAAELARLVADQRADQQATA